MATYIMPHFDPEDTPFDAVITKRTLEFGDIQKEIVNATAPRNERKRIEWGDSVIVLRWINGRLVGLKYSVDFGVRMSVDDVTFTKKPTHAVATLRVHLPGDEPSTAPEVPLYCNTAKLNVTLHMKGALVGAPPISELDITLKDSNDADDTPQPAIEDAKEVLEEKSMHDTSNLREKFEHKRDLLIGTEHC